MIFLHPLNALIPKILFSFFADFWVWVTPEARESVSVGFWGVPSIEPLLGPGGGSSQGALLTPPALPNGKPTYPFISVISMLMPMPMPMLMQMQMQMLMWMEMQILIVMPLQRQMPMPMQVQTLICRGRRSWDGWPDVMQALLRC